MDFFVYDGAGEVVNCIVADSVQVAADVVGRAYGPGFSVIERKGVAREVDIGDTFDKQARQFTKQENGRKVNAPADAAEAVAVSEIVQG